MERVFGWRIDLFLDVLLEGDSSNFQVAMHRDGELVLELVVLLAYVGFSDDDSLLLLAL